MGVYRHFPYSNFHEMNLDEIIKLMREMQDEWNATKQEWATYKDFIDNYFANLDVSEEVLEAIRTLASTGELNTIIDPTIATATAEWLAENITEPVGVVIDRSLTVEGACADAKATGDAITEVENLLLEDIGATFKNVDLGTLTTGRYVRKATGGTDTSASWNITGFKPVTGDYLMFTCPETSVTGTFNSVASLAWYRTPATAGFISAEDLIMGTNGVLKWRIVKVPEGTKYYRTSVYASTASDYQIIELNNVSDFIDNDDIKVYTRLNHSNQTYGFGADSMLIRLKRSAFKLGVSNNNVNYANPWEATWNAYYWLINNPDYMFATNCNFSGGYTSQEVARKHYPMRYNNTDYGEGPDGQPLVAGGHTRPILAIDTTNQDIKYYPMDTDITSIPATYNYAFACGNLLLENGNVVAGVSEPLVDSDNRNPRNVFGWDDDYFYIWFCEGRNDRNGGYKFSDMISRLQNYGVQNAVNLDGGGSTCVNANIPNTVKINEYADSVHIRPTALNMHYKYYGNTYNMMNATAKAGILAYIAQVFRPYKADLMRVLSTIYGHGTVKYVYHQENDGFYKLEVTNNPPTVQYIEFINYPVLSYHVGESLNLDGTVIGAIYDDDTIEDVTEMCSFSPANGTVLTASHTTLTVTFTEGEITRTTTVPIVIS